MTVYKGDSTIVARVGVTLPIAMGELNRKSREERSKRKGKRVKRPRSDMIGWGQYSVDLSLALHTTL